MSSVVNWNARLGLVVSLALGAPASAQTPSAQTPGAQTPSAQTPSAQTPSAGSGEEGVPEERAAADSESAASKRLAPRVEDLSQPVGAPAGGQAKRDGAPAAPQRAQPTEGQSTRAHKARAASPAAVTIVELRSDTSTVALVERAQARLQSLIDAEALLRLQPAITPKPTLPPSPPSVPTATRCNTPVDCAAEVAKAADAAYVIFGGVTAEGSDIVVELSAYRRSSASVLTTERVTLPQPAPPGPKGATEPPTPPSTGQQPTKDPTQAKQPAAPPSAAEPSAAQPSAAEPSAAEPSAAQPAQTEPAPTQQPVASAAQQSAEATLDGAVERLVAAIVASEAQRSQADRAPPVATTGAGRPGSDLANAVEPGREKAATETEAETRSVMPLVVVAGTGGTALAGSLALYGGLALSVAGALPLVLGTIANAQVAMLEQEALSSSDGIASAENLNAAATLQTSIAANASAWSGWGQYLLVAGLAASAVGAVAMGVGTTWAVSSGLLANGPAAEEGPAAEANAGDINGSEAPTSKPAEAPPPADKASPPAEPIKQPPASADAANPPGGAPATDAARQSQPATSDKAGDDGSRDNAVHGADQPAAGSADGATE